MKGPSPGGVCKCSVHTHWGHVGTAMQTRASRRKKASRLKQLSQVVSGSLNLLIALVQAAPSSKQLSQVVSGSLQVEALTLTYECSTAATRCPVPEQHLRGVLCEVLVVLVFARTLLLVSDLFLLLRGKRTKGGT